MALKQIRTLAQIASAFSIRDVRFDNGKLKIDHILGIKREIPLSAISEIIVTSYEKSAQLPGKWVECLLLTAMIRLKNGKVEVVRISDSGKFIADAKSASVHVIVRKRSDKLQFSEPWQKPFVT